MKKLLFIVVFLCTCVNAFCELQEVKGVESKIDGDGICFTNLNSFSVTVEVKIFVNYFSSSHDDVRTYQAASKSFVLESDESYTWERPITDGWSIDSRWNHIPSSGNYGKYYTATAYRLEGK